MSYTNQTGYRNQGSWAKCLMESELMVRGDWLGEETLSGFRRLRGRAHVDVTGDIILDNHESGVTEKTCLFS